MRKQEEGWLAVKVHRAPSSGNKKCREAFLTNLEEIKNALKTCTVRAVWQTMVSLRLYPGRYPGFWKLVQKYCPDQEIPSSSPPARETQEPMDMKPGLEETGTPPPTTIKPVAWQKPSSRPKRELVLDGKPMNSNGETID